MTARHAPEPSPASHNRALVPLPTSTNSHSTSDKPNLYHVPSGLHVSCGLIWLVTLMVQVQKFGLIEANRRRLMCLSMFWHFLDVIWIGVFTFVYLMGSM